MKTLNHILGLALTLCAAGATAAPLTPEQALARLQADAPQRVQAMALAQPATSLTFTQNAESGAPAVYVFSTPGHEGFMMLSADDCTLPVLGYADSGTFDPDNMAPALKWWLEEYARQIEYSTSITKEPYQKRTLSTMASKPAIAPMIQTHWDQGEPYNDQCPLYGTIRTWTGCVATAMSQVMNYWKYPAKGTGNISYTCDALSKRLTLDYAKRSFDWANMRDIYLEGCYSDPEAVAVAYLMKAAGYAVKSEYSTDATGALAMDIRKALRKYFNYDANMTYNLRVLYSAAQWEQMIYENLRDCGPILYGGGSYLGGGHSFVCDGYDGNGYYHFNWGWSGISDGYFALDALTPYALGTGGGGGGGYNFTQDAILGIRPSTGAEDVEEPLYLVQHGSLGGTITDNVLTATLDGQGDAMWVNYNNATMNESFYLIFEPQGMQAETKTVDISGRIYTLQAGYGCSAEYFENNAINLPEFGLVDGLYKVSIATLSNDNPDEGLIAPRPCYGYDTYFMLRKSGDTYTVENMPIPSIKIVNAEITNTLYYAGVANVSITLRNDSDLDLDAGYAPLLYINIDDVDYPYFLGESVYVTVPAHSTITKTWQTDLTQLQQSGISTDTQFDMTFFDEMTYNFYYDEFSTKVIMHANLGAPHVTVDDLEIADVDPYREMVDGVRRMVFVIPDRYHFTVRANLSLASGSAPMAYQMLACLLYPDFDQTSTQREILMSTGKPVVLDDGDSATYEVDMAYPLAEFDQHYTVALAYIYGSNYVGVGDEIVVRLEAPAGIEDVAVPVDPETGATQHVDNTIYNLQGVALGTDWEALPAGLYIQGGCKKLKK